MEPDKTYIIVRDSGSRRTGFVRQDARSGLVVVTDDLKQATVFTSEASAKGIACELNYRNRSGSNSWYAMEME